MASTTKADLVNTIADAAGLKKTTAEAVLNALTDNIKAALANGDKVTLVGFGSFAAAERAARRGRNPQTKEIIEIPASTTVRFKPGKGLIAAVN